MCDVLGSIFINIICVIICEVTSKLIGLPFVVVYAVAAIGIITFGESYLNRLGK